MRALAQNMEDKHYYYFLSLYFVFIVLFRIIGRVCPGFGINGYIGLSGLAEMIIAYPLMGYFISNRLRLTKKWILIPMWIFNLALLFVSCYWSHESGEVCFSYSQDFNAFTVYLTMMALFKTKENSLFEKAIVSIGGCTFGMYLFHPMLIDRIGPLTRFNHMIASKVTWMNAMVYDLLYVVWLMFLGYIITWILKKIPIVKKFL